VKIFRTSFSASSPEELEAAQNSPVAHAPWAWSKDLAQPVVARWLYVVVGVLGTVVDLRVQQAPHQWRDFLDSRR
jgi:hypothetical protein